MASYATPTDLIERYDELTLGDLASDTGTAPPDLTVDQKILTALASASGRVEAALMVGLMYDVADLGNLDDNSLALLKDIVCGLAMVSLIRRRPEKYASEATKAMAEEWEAYLDRLRHGERLFNLVNDTTHQDAGTPTIDGISTVEHQNLNLWTSQARNNFYPSPRFPIGR